MIYIKSIFLSLFFYSGYCNSQTVISVRIMDSSTFEAVANVIVMINNTTMGYTNNYGYFSREINCSGSNVEMAITHISYYHKSINVVCGQKNDITVYLKVKAEEISKVTVKGNKNFTKDFGTINIPVTYMKKIPYILGEPDPLKAIQTLPGVSSGFEANSGIYVRGGNIDQTAIYLDDAPVYNMGHLYGFFSPFDGEALKSFTFINSGIYGGFGGRGSSILDVRFREGNLKKHDGTFSAGFLSTKLLLEGPVIKNKLSYLGSVRFAYPLLLFNPLNITELDKVTNYFTDGNIKLKWVAGKNNIFYLSSFVGNDIFSMSDANEYAVGNSSISKYKWGNRTGTLRWNHINRNKSFLNTSASISKYAARAYFLESSEPDFGNELYNYSLKSELDNFGGKLKNCRLGFVANYYQSNQAILYFHRAQQAVFKENLLPQNNAVEACLFAENATKIKKANLTVTSNLRLGYYYNLNDKYSDPIFEPRIKAIKPFKRINVYAAYDKSSQYQSYVGNRQIAIPSDYWVQASRQFKAQKIHAFTLGVNKDFKKVSITLESFFKKYKNALDVKDGGVLFRNKDVLDDILYVKSMAYGAELLIEKHYGKFQGHCSYTLSRSIRKSPEINDNQWFASNFDRTHMLNLAIN